MLQHLHIENFAIIDNLELDFTSRMTVLTGETGAGKSIIVDTLALLLGGRAETGIIKNGKDRCEVSAIFDLKKIPEAIDFLKNQELLGDDENECYVRRIISLDGRSKNMVNGRPIPLHLLKELGNTLVNIHGQHEHYNLLKRTKQREALDLFAEHTSLCDDVKIRYSEWLAAKNELAALEKVSEDANNNLSLLKYQLQELDNLALKENELNALHAEHRELSNAEQIMTTCNNVVGTLDGENSNTALTSIYNAQKQLEKISTISVKINSAKNLLGETLIPLEAALLEIKDYLNKSDLNPERLVSLEKRLNTIYDLARKHHIKPEELSILHNQLKIKVNDLENASQKISTLKEKLTTLEKQYLNVATKLSQSRKKFAQKLEKLVTEKMSVLSMPDGIFKIIFLPLEALTSNHESVISSFSANGLEEIEFSVTANINQEPMSLNKVVSGGELSRISLALQTILAEKSDKATLIFDEVDVGIGGKTAEIVGKLLKNIGKNSQVICVTHLPQVASQGDNHFLVEKNNVKNTVQIDVLSLTKEKRIQEIARMLGGINITAKTLAHAEEMLSQN